MSEIYFNQRAEDCSKLASDERDPDLREMLRDLEKNYRAMARRALARYRSH